MTVPNIVEVRCERCERVRAERSAAETKGANARIHALWRLARNHPDEFEQLCDEFESAKEGAS